MTNHTPVHPAAGPPDHSGFLAGLQFDRGAPSSLRQAARTGNPSDFVRHWTSQLRHRTDSDVASLPARAFDWISVQPFLASAWRTASGRRSQRPVIGGDSQKRSPLPTIGRLADDASDGDLLAALALLTQPPPRKRIGQWLTALRTCIAQTTTRPLAPELAFTTGLLLSPLKGTARLRREGRQALQEELLENTDSDGTPRSELLSDLPEWLGAMVRAGYWGRRLGTPSWNQRANRRFAGLVHWATALYRHRDRLALSSHPARGLRELLDSAAQLVGQADRPRGAQSDWARVAVLRANRSGKAPAVVVTHDTATPRLDVSLGGRSLVCGEWSIDVSCGGHDWILDQWDCVCWQSDEDADYMELQADAGDGRRVDRHILLSRAEDLLVLADAVIGDPDTPDDARLECRSELTLPEGITARLAGKGRRDWRLGGPGVSARVFPVAVPDDSLQATGPSSVSCQNNRLFWSHARHGHALYLPIVIDFSSVRRRKPEWNPLTVTEDRQIVSPHRAAAYRLRLGDVQLVLYRSLATPCTPRSVIGQHINHETLIGLLRSDGDFSPLVMVE